MNSQEWGCHSSSSQSSVRWPLLCRRMLTSFPADLRLQRELFPAPARLVYLVEPLASSSQPGPDRRSLMGSPELAATSSRTSFGGSQPSISSGFLDCVLCFKTKLSQNPDFFSVFKSSFNRKLVLQETKELSVGDQSSQSLKLCLFYKIEGSFFKKSYLESSHRFIRKTWNINKEKAVTTHD